MQAPMATASSGVQPLCGSFARELLHQVDDRGHARRATTRMMWSILSLRGLRVADGLLDRTGDRTQQIVGELLETGTRELELEVQRAVAVRADERQLMVVSCSVESSIFAFSAAS